MANPTLTFTTSTIKINTGYTSNLKIKMSITRTAANKVKISASVYSQYEMYISYIYFHFACGNTYKKFTGNYHSITNGYTEITNSSGIRTTISTSTGGKWFTICKDKEFTIPTKYSKDDLYFATWFHAPSYYHVTVGAQKYKCYGGYTYKSNSLDSYYTAPSGLKLTAPTITSSSIKVKATWTKGSGSGTEYSNITAVRNTTDISYTKNITKSGNTTTFSGLMGNWNHKITGILYDSVSKKISSSAVSITILTLPQAPNAVNVISKINSLTISTSSNNSTSRELSYEYRYKLSTDSAYSSWTSPISHDKSYTIENLTPNTKYNIQIRTYTKKSDGKIVRSADIYSTTVWTKPRAVLNLSLQSGNEHNTIIATASAYNGFDEYAKYIFRIDSQSFNNNDYNTTIINPKVFSGLEGNSTHTIGIKMKNTESGLESDEVVKSITTWHNPLRDLKVNLVNRWYWFLSIASSYLYNGSISKFEYCIFDDPSNFKYIDRGTVNLYYRGTTEQDNPDNLKYNTDYNCSVRITDEYGRIYTANSVYRTLDERPIYVNGNLCEVKMIHIDDDNTKSVKYITPDIFRVINNIDGIEKIVHMNKIINNDDRDEFK